MTATTSPKAGGSLSAQRYTRQDRESILFSTEKAGAPVNMTQCRSFATTERPSQESKQTMAQAMAYTVGNQGQAQQYSTYHPPYLQVHQQRT